MIRDADAGVCPTRGKERRGRGEGRERGGWRRGWDGGGGGRYSQFFFFAEIVFPVSFSHQEDGQSEQRSITFWPACVSRPRVQE